LEYLEGIGSNYIKCAFTEELEASKEFTVTFSFILFYDLDSDDEEPNLGETDDLFLMDEFVIRDIYDDIY